MCTFDEMLKELKHPKNKFIPSRNFSRYGWDRIYSNFVSTGETLLILTEIALKCDSNMMIIKHW